MSPVVVFHLSTRHVSNAAVRSLAPVSGNNVNPKMVRSSSCVHGADMMVVVGWRGEEEGVHNANG